MLPKRGKAGGSSAKTPMQPRAKRTRRDNSQDAVQDTSVEAPTATAAVVPTDLKHPSQLHSKGVDPSLMVDYDESTPSLPSKD